MNNFIASKDVSRGKLQMSIRVPFILILSSLLMSCSGTPPDGKIADLHAGSNDLFIRMEKSGCYGRCPAYLLEIDSAGRVHFEGKGYTRIIGKAESQIDRNSILQIVQAIKSADYFSLANSYDEDSGNCPTISTDLPTVKLTIKLDGNEKTISHYLGCWIEDHSSFGNGTFEMIYPQQLYLLESKIDAIADSKKWVQEETVVLR